MEGNEVVFSDKIVSTERITLTDNGEVVPTEQDTTHILNTFFSNIANNLKFLNTLTMIQLQITQVILFEKPL